jgi:hypothetical protein
LEGPDIRELVGPIVRAQKSKFVKIVHGSKYRRPMQLCWRENLRYHRKYL